MKIEVYLCHLLFIILLQISITMSSIWQFLKRKVSRRKRDPIAKERSPENAPDGARDTPPASTTNGYTLDPYWQPLTKEEILADLAVEYEDVEEDENKAQMIVDVEPESMPTKLTSSSEPEVATYSAATEIISEPMSKIWRPHGSPIPVDDDERGVFNLEAGSESVKRSYMSIIPTTIQVLNEKTSLFVWHANFHPAIDRRFSSVIVSVKFTPAPENPQSKASAKTRQALRSANPFVLAHAPHKSFGATSSEQRSIAWGLELPITAPAGPISLGVTPSGQTETKKEVQHAFTITGSARGTPTRNTCVWTVQENSSTERGIPSELQLAALVQHTDSPLMMEIDITGRTAGGYLPSHDLRPKTTAMGRKKIVDPSKFKGLLYEFDLGSGDQVAASRQLLDKWTGKVDGAVLEFDQPLAHA